VETTHALEEYAQLRHKYHVQSAVVDFLEAGDKTFENDKKVFLPTFGATTYATFPAVCLGMVASARRPPACNTAPALGAPLAPLMPQYSDATQVR
jgi:hypothetical protein